MNKLIIASGIILLLSSCEVKVKPLAAQTEKQHVETTQNIPFPLETKFTNEYLKASFWKCNYSSAGEPLAYWVILPNQVKPTKLEPVQIEKLNLTNIGQYTTIDKSAYIEVEVAYETLKTEVQPSDWLLGKLKLMKETVLNQNLVKAANGEQYLDVLTRNTLANGETLISRSSVLKSGANYFVIRVSSSRKDYADLAETMQHISTNWGLKN